GSPPPQNVRVSNTTKKIIMPVFWDSKGMIHLDNLEKIITIKGAYYAKLLKNVCVAIKEQRRGLVARGPRLQQDNSLSHNSHIEVARGRNCGFEILSHLLYS
ncbi:hypothetical protein CAPTEDRAFT_28007, partial [Capitella teleta]